MATTDAVPPRAGARTRARAVRDAPTPAPGAGRGASAPGSGRRVTPPVDPRLVRYAAASRGYFALSAVIVLAQTAVVIGFAWALTAALTGVLDGLPVEEWAVPLGAGLALVVARAGLAAASDHVSARGAARVSLQLRAALVAAIGRLGPAWTGERNAAALAVTAGHGLESLDAYFARYLPALVATVIATPVLVVAIAIADPISGLTVLLTLPLIPLFMVLIGLATRAVQRRQYDTLTRLAARFADTVGGLGTLKVFGRQHRASASIATVTAQYKRETMTVLRVSFLSGFALEFLASLSVAVIAVTIGLRLLGGDLSLSVGLMVLLLAPEAYLPLRQVGVQFHAAAEGVAATDEVFAVLDAAREPGAGAPPAADREPPSQEPEGASSRSARATTGRAPAEAAGTTLIEARALRVRRGGRLLEPVELTVRTGEVVLVEGPSGAGKSSLVAALLGFGEFDGALLVEGRPAGEEGARRIVAWSGQRAGLMSGTILDNVTLGDPTPDGALAQECLVAAQAPGADLATELGALGAGLSGGQAQRVAIARALYRLRSAPARVLALDEPSSALDAATEASLWAALRAEADAGAGVLLVSHRMSARGIADRIVTLSGQDAAEPVPPETSAAPAAPGAQHPVDRSVPPADTAPRSAADPREEGAP